MKRLLCALVLLAACDKPATPAPTPKPLPLPPVPNPDQTPAPPDLPKDLPVQPGDLASLGFPKDAEIYKHPSPEGTWKADISAATMRLHFEVTPKGDEASAIKALLMLADNQKAGGATIEVARDDVTATLEIPDAGRTVIRARRVGTSLVVVSGQSLPDKNVPMAELKERVDKTLALIATRIGGGGKRSGASDVDATKAILRQVSDAVELFKLDHNRYPDSLDDLASAVRPAYVDAKRDWRPLLKAPPRDGWGNPLIFRVPGSGGWPFDVISQGEDGKEGGVGFATDLSNHEK